MNSKIEIQRGKFKKIDEYTNDIDSTIIPFTNNSTVLLSIETPLHNTFTSLYTCIERLDRTERIIKYFVHQLLKPLG